MFELVFISYSQHDKDIAERLEKYLTNAGILLWRDNQNLPGTPNFEIATRKALKEALALLYLGSPQSQVSSYVLGEISLAERRGIPIIPLWVDGESWDDSSPLNLVKAPYIDCRGQSFDNGMQQLSTLLFNHIEKNCPRWGEINENNVSYIRNTNPKHYTLISSSDNSPSSIRSLQSIITRPGILVNYFRNRSYSNVQSLLDDLYINSLSTRFKPYTYGEQWGLSLSNDLMKFPLDVLLFPWQWLQTARYRKSTSRYSHEIQEESWSIDDGFRFLSYTISGILHVFSLTDDAGVLKEFAGIEVIHRGTDTDLDHIIAPLPIINSLPNKHDEIRADNYVPHPNTSTFVISNQGFDIAEQNILAL